MIRRSLKLKIILPVVIVLILFIATMTIYSSVRFASFAEILFDERIAITANGLKNYLSDCEHNSKTAAFSVSADAAIIKAVKERDTKEIIRLLKPTLELYSITHYTVTDEAGTVLARTHDPDNFGDSVLGQQNIKDALEGMAASYCEEGTVVKVSVRTGAPIYDTDGTLIGVISAGVRLDTDEAVDGLKRYFNTDFTVYYGDTRVATTLIRDGQRITNTKLNPAIAKIVFGEKKEFLGNAGIMGEDYSAFYMPLTNAQNEVFAILATVHSNINLIAAETAIIRGGIIIGFLALVISILALLLINEKIISPVNRLVHLVSEITQGNIDIGTEADLDRTNVAEDEIGVLTLDIYSLIDVVKSMLGDLSRLTQGLNIYSEMNLQIDSDKYDGYYKEIIVGINTLVGSISMMKKTMAVVDYLDTMISVTDLDYNLLYVNRSMADTFLMDRENCIGKKCYKAIRNLDEPCDICQLSNLLPNKESFPSIDYEFIRDVVSGAWIGGRAAIMRWVDGDMVFFNSINDETLKMKQRERLREAVETAEAASAAKSAFLANMSHELRTPLNVVVGLADLQLEDDTLPEEIGENLRKISNAGKTLLSIVNDILDISKIESGKFDLAPVEYHMASLLNDIVILVTSRIDEKPIKFCLNISEDLPAKLYGDDLRVKQILNNLLSNAIKYTHQGTVELRLRCVPESNDSIDTGRGGGVWLEIAVTDTGIGIHPEDLKKLFSDYNQVDVLANRKVEGTGLGLAITKRLVESMDGEIFVESEYGKGSTFRIRILQISVNAAPIGPAVAEELRNFRYNDNKYHSASVLVRADLSYAKVLVVDDLQANLDVAAGLLRKYKMQVDCVTSGQAAIDMMKLGQPLYNAIFMDHMMPEMDGIETAVAIRALDTEYTRNIPIIALTANAVVGTEELFYQHGFQAYITKPIDIMRLDAAIRQWIKVQTNDDEAADSNQENPYTANTPAIGIPVFLPVEDEQENLTIDIEGLNTKKGLAICCGDHKIYRSILRAYVADAPVMLEKLRLVTKETLPDYTIAVHGVKGASANIGAEAIREAAASLEAMAKNNDLFGISFMNNIFLQEFEYLIEAIKGWFEKHPGDQGTKPRLPAPDRSLLARLRQSCERCDPDEAEKILDELESANYEKDAGLIIWLRDTIDVFEFDEVVERLKEYEYSHEVKSVF